MTNSLNTKNSTKIVKKTVAVPDIGKLPPQARELEEAVLGALMLEKDAYEAVSNFLTPECFYDPVNQIIYSAIQGLSAQYKPIDLLTVVEELKRKNELEMIGGAVCIAELSEKVASAAHIEYHARVVFQNYLRRKHIEICYQSAQNAYDLSIDIADIIPDCLNSLENIENATTERETKTATAVVYKSAKEYEERAKRASQGLQVGMHTGLLKLDKWLHGFQRGALYIIAGRPGMGKTALALHIARKTAMQGNSVVVFSLEMTDVSLIDRMVIADSGIDASSYKQGRLTQQEFEFMAQSQERISMLPLHINDTADITASQIKAHCKKLKRKGKCDIVIVDYLGLIKMINPSGKSTNDIYAECTRQMKILAKEVDAPVILLSQLNREVEKRPNKRPMLSDLRDSGAIEQDADVVMFPVRMYYYTKNEAEKNKMEIIIAKHREGQTGYLDVWTSDTVSDFKDEPPHGYAPAKEVPPPFHEPRKDYDDTPF